MKKTIINITAHVLRLSLVTNAKLNRAHHRIHASPTVSASRKQALLHTLAIVMQATQEIIATYIPAQLHSAKTEEHASTEPKPIQMIHANVSQALKVIPVK
jgi:hypothetical protein